MMNPCIDDKICVGTKRSITIQPELTMTDITALQLDNQNRQEEVKYSGHGYREQLQADKMLLIFCTCSDS